MTWTGDLMKTTNTSYVERSMAYYLEDEFTDPIDQLPQLFTQMHPTYGSNAQFHEYVQLPDECMMPLTMHTNECYLEDDGDDYISDEEGDRITTEVLMTINVEGVDRLFRCLLDSGTSRSLGTADAVKRAQLDERPNKTRNGKIMKLRYKTAKGAFETKTHAIIKKHRIVDLSGKRQLADMKFQIHRGKLGRYDFILGSDYMRRYGIDLRFSKDIIEWDDCLMPMHQQGFWSNERLEDLFLLLENPELNDLMEGDLIGYDESFVAKILDSKYEKQDLPAVADQQKHLSPDQRDKLLKVLRKHERLFSGKLGVWKGETVDIELRPNAQPYHCRRPMRIPHIHLPTLKKETERLVDIGVLERTKGDSPWCAPSWCIPKKDGRIRFITDYRELNKAIVRHPWPMPHISDMIENIGKYKYATCLDLSMGYYHLKLSEAASDLTTFMLPFGCFKYKRLPMGLNISPDIFQRLMLDLFSDLDFVNCYLDDIAIISNGSYEDHLEKVSIVLSRFDDAGLAVNALKSFWATSSEVEYLGFLLTPHGIRPQPKKIEAIQRLQAPRNRKELRRIVGLVNYYRYMWRHRSHLLAPLTSMLSTTKKFIWTPECQAAFDSLKNAITKEVMLTFPDYSKPFHLFTDACDYQLGAVLTQEHKPIAFFSRKLNDAQKKYGVGEKEMLSIVETLKEFRTILLGYPVIIHTDHKNLAFDKQLNNPRVLRWRLAIEEYMPTLQWVPGVKNPVADLLSRHPIAPKTTEGRSEEENFSLPIFDDPTINLAREYTVPLKLKEIYEAQLKDPAIRKLQDNTPNWIGRVFDNTGEKTGPQQALTITHPTTKEPKILVPKSQTQRLIHWYHHMLVHPGADRLYNTLSQHFYWKLMKADIQAFSKKCHACQKGKRGLRGYGKIPMKDVESQPWLDVALDLYGPLKAKINEKTVTFHALTMIDPFTSWVEVIPIYTKEAPYIRDQILQQWLRRYPRPSRFIYDQGTEFDNSWLWALCKRWEIQPTPITVRNPRGNAIVERMHKVLGDMLRCQLTTRHPHDDPVADMLTAAAYGIRSTVHGTTRYTPGQMIFSRDMILRTHMEADMELIRLRRRKAVEVNNARENRRRIAYQYKPGDKVLLLTQKLDPKLKLNPGPYKVEAFDPMNGTLQIRRGNYIEPVNIRLVRPYFQK